MPKSNGHTPPETNKAPSGRKAGKPPTYNPDMAEQAKKLSRLGATTADLADFFGVAVRTVRRWRVEHEAFANGCKVGDLEANARVETALFSRAVGYEHDATKVMQHKGRIISHEYRERFPPDVAAITTWLVNRSPDRWRSRTELTGANGGPVALVDVSELTPVERAQRIASLLSANGGLGKVIDGTAETEQSPDA